MEKEEQEQIPLEDTVPLKLLREEVAKSQEDLAQAISVSSNTVSRWESGENEPTFTLLQVKKLARLFGISEIEGLPDYLVTPETRKAKRRSRAQNKKNGAS